MPMSGAWAWSLPPEKCKIILILLTLSNTTTFNRVSPERGLLGSPQSGISHWSHSPTWLDVTDDMSLMSLMSLMPHLSLSVWGRTRTTLFTVFPVRAAESGSGNRVLPTCNKFIIWHLATFRSHFHCFSEHDWPSPGQAGTSGLIVAWSHECWWLCWN